MLDMWLRKEWLILIAKVKVLALEILFPRE
jgi:hypothetical protein